AVAGRWRARSRLTALPFSEIRRRSHECAKGGRRPVSSRRFRYWRIQLLIGAFALLLVGRMAAQVVWRVSAPYVIRTIEARLGSVEETFTGPGRAVRAEVVVRSPQQGVVTHLVREGQRVRQGEIVAEV